MRKADIIIALFLLLICVAIWVNTAHFKGGIEEFDTMGAGTYPRFLALGIASFACAMLISRAAVRPSRKRETVSWGSWYKVSLGAAVMFAQAFLLEEIGYFTSSLICIAALMWILSVSWWRSIIFSAVFLFFVYLFFFQFIGIRLPVKLPFIPI